MKWIRRKTGEVELDTRGDLVLQEGDDIVYETNEPREFYGSWMNTDNRDRDDRDVDKPGELGTYENTVEKKLHQDEKAVGWHEPYIPHNNPVRLCLYCNKKLPEKSRADKKFCNQKCRQNYRYHEKVKQLKKEVVKE